MLIVTSQSAPRCDQPMSRTLADSCWQGIARLLAVAYRNTRTKRSSSKRLPKFSERADALKA